MLDPPLEPLDKASRPGGTRRVAAGQVRQLVRHDRAQLTLRQHAEKRQPDQERLRTPPGDDPTAGQIGQPHLPGRFDAQPPPNRIDRPEEQRRIDAGHDRTQVAVGILRDDWKPDAAQCGHDVRPSR